MTREEAIVVLKAFMDNPLFSDVHKTAFSIAIHDIKQRHEWDINKLMLVSKTEREQESTTKNDLGVDCIDRAELLKAMDTWDKFGDDPNKGLIPLRTPTLQDKYVPYVKYDDMINCVKGMPPVTPQEPILDKIYADIQRLRGCSCSCSDGIIDDVEDILDKYKAESEVGDGKID